MPVITTHFVWFRHHTVLFEIVLPHVDRATSCSMVDQHEASGTVVSNVPKHKVIEGILTCAEGFFQF